MDNEGKLFIKNDKGEEKEYSVLVTFDIESKNKSYVLFTDFSRTGEGALNIYPATYDKTGKDMTLGEVTEPDEIEIINEYVKQIEERLRAGAKLF